MYIISCPNVTFSVWTDAVEFVARITNETVTNYMHITGSFLQDVSMQ
jgi:hypothetical protein